jgi:8-oxo-dGTP pyrophosphatase MutT (NUDIX family)
MTKRDYQSDAPWILEDGEPSVPAKRAAMILVTHPGWALERGPAADLFLVVEEKSGDVLLPGGHVEYESISQAGQRELKEETDLHVYHEDLVPIARGQGIAEPECEVTVLLARIVFGEEKPMEPETKLHWTNWKTFLARSSFRDFYEKHFPKGFSHLKATVWKT